MHSIEFQYKKLIGGFAPIIPITLFGNNSSSLVEAYVDSGAAMSLFDSVVADILGISWQSGKRKPFITGDGKTIYGFTIPLRISIGGVSFVAPIAFSSQLKIGFNLIGRSGVFSEFHEIAFQEKKHKLIFRSE